jgi:hypothetical protein
MTLAFAPTGPMIAHDAVRPAVCASKTTMMMIITAIIGTGPTRAT